jgi:hypothetical protein
MKGGGGDWKCVDGYVFDDLNVWIWLWVSNFMKCSAVLVLWKLAGRADTWFTNFMSSSSCLWLVYP